MGVGYNITNSASGGTTLQTLFVGVGYNITNSASGGRGATLQTLFVGLGVQHYKLC